MIQSNQRKTCYKSVPPRSDRSPSNPIEASRFRVTGIPLRGLQPPVSGPLFGSNLRSDRSRYSTPSGSGRSEVRTGTTERSVSWSHRVASRIGADRVHSDPPTPLFRVELVWRGWGRGCNGTTSFIMRSVEQYPRQTLKLKSIYLIVYFTVCNYDEWEGSETTPLVSTPHRELARLSS
jgi:hypothetical protein